MRNFGYSIVVIIVGICFIVLMSGIYGLGGSGELTSGVFYSGTRGITFSIIFLSGVIVFSTYQIIEELKKSKK